MEGNASGGGQFSLTNRWAGPGTTEARYYRIEPAEIPSLRIDVLEQSGIEHSLEYDDGFPILTLPTYDLAPIYLIRILQQRYEGVNIHQSMVVHIVDIDWVSSVRSGVGGEIILTRLGDSVFYPKLSLSYRERALWFGRAELATGSPMDCIKTLKEKIQQYSALRIAQIEEKEALWWREVNHFIRQTPVQERLNSIVELQKIDDAAYLVNPMGQKWLIRSGNIPSGLERSIFFRMTFVVQNQVVETIESWEQMDG